MNDLEAMKYKLIKEIIERRDFVIEALYEILVNEDYDYIRNLMTKEDFDEFIEKGTPKKEEQND